jgi:hypothetical protein
MDLATILKAVQLVGGATPAAIKLYQGFIAVTRGADQAELKARYEAARLESDRLHQEVQNA